MERYYKNKKSIQKTSNVTSHDTPPVDVKQITVKEMDRMIRMIQSKISKMLSSVEMEKFLENLIMAGVC